MSDVDRWRGEGHAAHTQVDRGQVDGHLSGQSQNPVIRAGSQRNDSGQVDGLHGQIELRMYQAGPRHLVATT